MVIFAIDPGTTETGYIILGEEIMDMGKRENVHVENLLFSKRVQAMHPHVVVEMVKSYGMPVGDTTFRTVWWLGRFALACDQMGYYYHEVTRNEVKNYLCHSSRASDSNIRQALIDRYEPDLEARKRPKGFLKGVSKDMWSALAVAVYFKNNYNFKHHGVYTRPESISKSLQSKQAK